MGLTEEIKKGLDVDLENKFAAAVDKGICDGACDTIFFDIFFLSYSILFSSSSENIVSQAPSQIPFI